MSAIEPQTDQATTRRLSFRQKFWLFGVGVPVLLIVVLLALAVFLPKPLSLTEQKLLGRWEVVSPTDMKGTIIEFQSDYVSSDSSPWHWRADATNFYIAGVRDPEYWSQIQLSVGLRDYEDEYHIDRLTEDELQFSTAAGVVKLKRIEK